MLNCRSSISGPIGPTAYLVSGAIASSRPRPAANASPSRAAKFSAACAGRELIGNVRDFRPCADVCTPPLEISVRTTVDMQRTRQPFAEKLGMHESDPLHGVQIDMAGHVDEQAEVRRRGQYDAD